MIPVQGHDHLYRDEKTGAIVNDDNSSYNTYMQMKGKKRKEREEIDNMKKDIGEMKEMQLYLNKPLEN